jgi:CubicO group peptidase (beta-lactamase class C family)
VVGWPRSQPFSLLGEILARQAGTPLDVFAKQEIFIPLGMTRTCFNPPDGWKSEIPPTEDDRNFRHRVIQGEVNDENAWVMGGVAGHAGLFAAATDAEVRGVVRRIVRYALPDWPREHAPEGAPA